MRHTRFALVTGVQTCARPIAKFAQLPLSKSALVSVSTLNEVAEQISARQVGPASGGIILRNTSTEWFSPTVSRELAEIVEWVNHLNLKRPELLVVATALSEIGRASCRERVCQYV